MKNNSKGLSVGLQIFHNVGGDESVTSRTIWGESTYLQTGRKSPIEDLTEESVAKLTEAGWQWDPSERAWMFEID